MEWSQINWGVPSSNVIILGVEKVENHWIRHSNDIQQALIPCLHPRLEKEWPSAKFTDKKKDYSIESDDNWTTVTWEVGKYILHPKYI